MKRALITLAASALAAGFVTASHAADRLPPSMMERAELVRTIDVSPCTPPPGAFACDQGRHSPPTHGAPPPRDFPGRGQGRGAAFPPGPGPLFLAARLSAIETFIGIKGGQLDAWRAFTDALQASLAPPSPPTTGDPLQPPDALSQSAELARRSMEQGKGAATLSAAVDALRGTLSPAQMERLSAAGPLLPPPPFAPPPGEAPAFNFPASCGPSGPGGPGRGPISPP